MKNEKFTLSNVVLYAKGWYKKTDNVFEDLKEILKLDDYTPFTNGDVFSILVDNFERFNIQASSLRETLFGIHPSECWKYGYFVKQNKQWSNQKESELPEYDMPTATIYYILSTLRFLDREKWESCTPLFSKYPKNPNIPTKRIIEVFNKKTTQHYEK